MTQNTMNIFDGQVILLDLCHSQNLHISKICKCMVLTYTIDLIGIGNGSRALKYACFEFPYM